MSVDETLPDIRSRSEAALPRPVRKRLKRHLLRPQPFTPLQELGIGLLAAAVAMAIRYVLPLGPMQLPTITVVIAIAIVTTFVGLLAGVTTAISGGLLAWYILFTPFSWEMERDAAVPLFGFTIIAGVIVTTSHLYRRSEQRSHEAELAALQDQAEAARLFAKEMAHRLKNALAIVQSISFQTLGSESPETSKFAARLRALSGAHDLLSEHVQQPSAPVAEVVGAALQPFDAKARFDLEITDARISARQVVTLALALHELAANALRYGALSVPGGQVSLRIEDVGQVLRCHWVEIGGPEVQAPDWEGFGVKLLRRLGADTDLNFKPDGVRCSWSVRKS